MLKIKVSLVMIGSLMMAASFIVLVRNRSLDTELLASIAFLGSLAVVIVAVLLKNGGNNGGS